MNVANEGRYYEDCMVCGAKQPPGHVVVYDENHKRREGRICSSHTFWEVISHPSDRFMVEVTVDNGPHPFTDALERVQEATGVDGPPYHWRTISALMVKCLCSDWRGGSGIRTR